METGLPLNIHGLLIYQPLTGEIQERAADWCISSMMNCEMLNQQMRSQGMPVYKKTPEITWCSVLLQLGPTCLKHIPFYSLFYGA